MNEDSIIEQTRRVGQSYVDSFHGDWKAMIADLQHRARADGREPLRLPPKSPRRTIVIAEK